MHGKGYSISAGINTGGVADKVANRYERTWIAWQFMRILSGQATSITVECCGEDSAEFSLTDSTGTEWHQVKSTNAGNKYSPKLVGQVLAKLAHRYVGADRVWFVTKEDAGKARDICDNVRNAGTYEEFDRHGSQANKTSLASFGEGFESASHEDTFQKLRRTYVEQKSEYSLTQQLQMSASIYCSGDPVSACDALLRMADSFLGSPIEAHHIWAYLDERGIRAVPQVTTNTFFSLCENQAAAYVHSQAFDIYGLRIERSEATTITRFIDVASDSTTCFLHGGAGAGKSSILAQTIEKIHEHGWTALVFRLDKPAHIQTLLEECTSGKKITLVQALAQVSAIKKVVVILDQLDALSDVSGRRSEEFDDIEPIIGQLANLKNVHLVLSCRTHDLLFDARFRRLKHHFGVTRNDRVQEVKVGKLEPGIIKDFLSRLDINSSELNDSTLDLVGNPSELVMFVALVKESPERGYNFGTPFELLTAFWNHKYKDFRHRYPTLDWDTALQQVVSVLNRRQALAVSKRFLSGPQTAALVACGVLVEDDSNQVAFAHETMFDYAFARSLCETDQPVLEWLLSTEQHLFQRGQLRQILAYLRTTDLPAFFDAARALLASPDVRPHLKASIFQTFNLIERPTQEDWSIVQPYWTSEASPLAQLAANAVWRSTRWAAFLDESGILLELLAREDRFISDRALSVIRGLDGDRADLVAKYALWIFENRPDLENSACFMLSHCTLDECPDVLLPALMESIKRGLHDRNGPRSYENFWDMINRKKGLPKASAIELVGVYLTSIADRGVHTEQLSQHIHGISGFIYELAKECPWEFIRAVLPLHLTIFNNYKAGLFGYDSPYSVWSGASNPDVCNIDDILLFSLSLALGKLWDARHDGALSVAEKLLATDTKTAKAIILMAAEHCPSAEAASALLLLLARGLEDPNQADFYCLGQYWFHALAAVAPHISEDHLPLFERAFMMVWPPKEFEHAHGDRYLLNGRPTPIGQTQYLLLSGLEQAHLSLKARHRLAELKRKFGLDMPTDRGGVGKVGWVGSPLPEIAHQKMSDKQWLAAMRNPWPREWRKEIDGHLAGSGSELARYGLSKQVEQQPDRFLGLFFKHFDNSIPIAYWDAVLEGLQKVVDVDPRLFSAVCQRCMARSDSDQLHMSLVRLLRSMEARLLDDACLEMLCDLAAGAPDPETDMWRVEASEGKPYYGGDIDGYGINCVRGVAAETLEQYFYEYPEHWSKIERGVAAALTDQVLAVRACIIGICPSLTHHKIRDGVPLFVECIGDDLELATARGTRHCFNYFLLRAWPQLKPLIERLYRSENDSVAEEGAILMGFAWLHGLIGQEEFSVVADGSDIHRVGCAKVCVSNFRAPEFRDKCLGRLHSYFHDDDEKVREVADNFVNHIEKDEVAEYSDIISAYLASPAFSGEDRLFYRLFDADTACVPPDLLLQAADALITLSPGALSDTRTAIPLSAETLSRLLVAAYNNTQDPDLRQACLDRIDHLVLAGAYGLEKTLKEYSRL